MFAARGGFFYQLSSTTSNYWVNVFDDFNPAELTVINNGTEDIVYAGGSTISGTSASEIYNINQNGNVLFQKSFTSGATGTNGSVIDSSGNLYIVGLFSSSIAYVAKFNTAGATVWQKQIATGTYYAINLVDLNGGSDPVVVVTGTDTTGADAYIVLYQSDGSTYAQKSFSIYNNSNAVTSTISGFMPSFAILSVYQVGPTSIVVSQMDDGLALFDQGNISDSSGALSNGAMGYNSAQGRVYISVKYTAGTNAGRSALTSNLIGPGGVALGVSEKILSGLITGALLIPSNSDNVIINAARQTNNTVWIGKFASGSLASFTFQRNFYFGTAGTNTTIITNVITSSTSASNQAIYICGTTTYYGGTKGYIARLPIDGTIPGTGTYGSSGEIKYTTSTYMTLSNSSLGFANTFDDVSDISYTISNSSLTNTTSTGAYTTNAIA